MSPYFCVFLHFCIFRRHPIIIIIIIIITGKMFALVTMCVDWGGARVCDGIGRSEDVIQNDSYIFGSIGYELTIIKSCFI
jgi:hypothetical protein